MTRTIGFAFFLLASASAAQANAQTVTWSPSNQFDNGAKPAVALGTDAIGNWEVEVHEAQSGLGPLWYSAGFGSFGSGSIYTYGVSPALASLLPASETDAYVIEVHQAQAGEGPLWFTVGDVSTVRQASGAATASVAWATPLQYDNGYHPAIGASNGVAVEVHQAAVAASGLWFRTGSQASPGQAFAWNSGSQYDYGANPSVSVAGAWVVEVHQASTGVGPLWFRTGALSGSQVTWSANSFQYDVGENPSVAISGNTVVEVHQGSDGPGGLWYHVGVISARGGDNVPQIAWEPNAYEYDSGMQPSIAWNPLASAGTEVHAAGSGIGPIWDRNFTIVPAVVFPSNATCANAPAATFASTNSCNAPWVQSGATYGSSPCPEAFSAQFYGIDDSYARTATAAGGMFSAVDCPNTVINLSAWGWVTNLADKIPAQWVLLGTNTATCQTDGITTTSQAIVGIPESYPYGSYKVGSYPVEIGTVTLIAQAVTTHPLTGAADTVTPVALQLQATDSWVTNPPTPCTTP